MALSPLASAQLDNKGDDFIVSFLPNVQTGETVQVHLTSDVATNVTVQYPVNGPFALDTTVAVAPGAITIVDLPLSASEGWTANTTSNNAVHCFGGDDFVVYLINVANVSSDAGLGLPIDVFNTEYIVVDYPSLSNFRNQFVVWAAFDGTLVTITPTNDLVGHPANVSFDVLLNRGEGYLAEATVGAVDLIGTIVSADRPVGMTNGCVPTVPVTVTAADQTFEVAQPVQTWGTQVLVANLPDRPTGTIYRIVASQDGTTVTQDGAFLATLNRGQFFETPVLPGNHIFAADLPFFVVQFMTGNSSPGATTGDPSMGNMIPCEQYLSDYTFSTVGGAQFLLHFLTVIADDTDVATITLDGAPIGAGAFTPIPGSGFSVAILPLTDGTHATSSNGIHGITVEGYNGFDSYLYPGGAAFEFINPTGDANPPLCEIINRADNQAADGTAMDNRPSEDTNGNGMLDPGEDLNMNGQIDEDTGIFFIELKPGSSNITLTVDPFTPGDGVVMFVVDLIDPMVPGSGAIGITDGAGNETCCDVSLRPEIGTNYCGPAVLNSTGQPGTMSATGSTVVADNDLTLTASQLPIGEFGIFLAGPSDGLFAPAASCGIFCLKGGNSDLLGRFNRPGELFQVSPTGTGSLIVDLTDIPIAGGAQGPPGPFSRVMMPGDTWNFQAWYRDTTSACAMGNNFTDAVQLMFQ
ncbi:MAG: hypothetical protein GY711_06355 [bacterium]|nr:hypothetical protein [bacterium]